jgi:hypothetical protein
MESAVETKYLLQGPLIKAFLAVTALMLLLVANQAAHAAPLTLGITSDTVSAQHSGAEQYIDEHRMSHGGSQSCTPYGDVCGHCCVVHLGAHVTLPAAADFAAWLSSHPPPTSLYFPEQPRRPPRAT